MNVLFMTTGTMQSIEQHSIYPDLLRYFRDKGHNVYCVSSYEKRTGKETELVEEKGVKLLHVRIGNITKTNTIEKGISTLRIEHQYKSAIKSFWSDIKFDLVMYSTPPITLVKVIEFLKNREHCKTYLLLKDIFPQNAVDLGMLNKKGLKGALYKFFRKKEKKLYQISDYIGCMSKANVDYVIKHNPEIDPDVVNVCPNCIDVIDMSVNELVRRNIRQKYNLPQDIKIFLYGGNLGKPQGINFMLECLKSQAKNNSIHFLIVGDGTEFSKIDSFIKSEKLSNVSLMKRLPKEDYDQMVGACDVGMIFLDHRFTIPNFPSRLLSYMQAKLPVLAVTDSSTDIGSVVVNGNFGWWCESNDINSFSHVLDEAVKADCEKMGENSYLYLLENYTCEIAYRIIINCVDD